MIYELANRLPLSIINWASLALGTIITHWVATLRASSAAYKSASVINIWSSLRIYGAYY
jgi:hypothetical protein